MTRKGETKSKQHAAAQQGHLQPSNQELRWGILGCGAIANDFANALKCVPGCILEACASQSQDKAKQFHDMHGFQKHYDSHDKLVQDSNVQVVYVASLHVQHYHDVMLCLQNGKHVLVEKPMALSHQHAQEMAQLAKKNNLFLMEGMWTMCFPAIQKVRELLQKKAVGEIKHVMGDFGVQHSPEFERIWKSNLGGGGLADIGSYLLAMSALIFNMEPPTRIVAGAGINQDKIDLYGNMMIEYSNNRVSCLNYTVQANTPREVYICGTEGLIRIHRFFNCPTMVTLIKYLGNGNEKKTRYKFELPEHIRKDTLSNFENASGFIYEIQSFKNALENGMIENPQHTLEQTLFNARLMEEVKNQIGLEHEQSKVMQP